MALALFSGPMTPSLDQLNKLVNEINRVAYSSGTGTVTSITAGTGLSGGTITGTGTIAVANKTANTLAGFNNSGVFSDVTIGTNLTLSGGVLDASGGGFVPDVNDSLLAGASTGGSITGAQNNVIGSQSLKGTGNGFANNGIGANSLPILTTGLANSYIGDSCGSTITTGHHNTCLGSNTDVDAANASHRIALGVGAIATADNAGQIGDASFTNLRIGTASGTLQTKNNALISSSPFAIGDVNAGAVTADTTRYLEILVGGVVYKIIIST